MNKTEISEKGESNRNERNNSKKYSTETVEDAEKDFNPELMPLHRLDMKIGKSMENRKITGERVKIVKKEYDLLKGEIKKFLRKQIVSSNQVTSKKKTRVKKNI